MLSNAKYLLAGHTLYIVIARLILCAVIAREHSDRGNLSQYVILSATKDLLAGYALSMWVVAGRL